VSDTRQPDHAALLKRSLIAIDQLQAKLAALERERAEPIAIVGVGCRFPMGADSPAAFWALLRNGVDAVTEVPKERWDADAFYDPNPDTPGKSYTKSGDFTADTVVHELTHELMHQWLNYLPNWVVEGTATPPCMAGL